MSVTRELFIDAICGAGFPSGDFADRAVARGLARSTGNQWNPSWAWERRELEKAEDEELRALYTLIKEQQHASK